MKPLFKIICMSALLFLCACEPENPVTPPPGDEEQVPDSPQEKPEPEPPVEKPSEPFSSAVLNFCYYDVEGVIDHESRRVDFELEVYGTDTPNLTNQSLIFDLKEGFAVRNVEGNVVNITLSVKKPVKITFLEGENALEYEIYVNHIVKESSVTEFEFKAGVNLSYWFQTDIPWPDDITLEQIMDCGFDHVRLPVDSSCLFDEKGNIRQDIMNQVHHVIKKSLDLGLNVIFDMHWLVAGNMFYQEDAAQELVNNWKKLMNELKAYPNDRLAYEVLNEPYGPGWGLMQRRMLHLIRHYEPGRVIFVSPDKGDNVDSCAEFYLHGGDPNLVMTFHYYQPMLASHKKLWEYTGPSHYPGLLFSDEEWDNMTDAQREQAQWHRDVVYDYDYVYDKMSAAAAMAKKNELRLQCGEFGFSKMNIREERVQWFKDVVKAFNECDIIYTVWENWVGDFGPGNWASEPDEEIIDILLCRD